MEPIVPTWVVIVAFISTALDTVVPIALAVAAVAFAALVVNIIKRLE